MVANRHCCHLKHLKPALAKAAFPGKAGLYLGWYFVIALVWTNTQNKCSGLEQHSQPIREWQLQVHYWNNLPVKFYPEDNPIYFPQCTEGNYTILMEKASKQLSYIQGIKGDNEGAQLVLQAKI